MDNYLYLIINLSSLSVPLALSFEHRVAYFSKFISLKFGFLITTTFFIVHDILFTYLGVWGFNDLYLIGVDIFGLPIEEWLFFFCIPFSSLFIHFCKEYFTPKLKFSHYASKIISISIIAFLIITVILNPGNYYTVFALGLAALLMGLGLIRTPEMYSSFLLSYFFILIPFFIINGLLTGSHIPSQIVWYNDLYNLGVRIGTIPFEDIFYGFSLLFLPLYLKEEMSIRKSLKR